MMNPFLTKPFHRFFRKNEVKLHELNYLFWECTWRCNLRCRHCGSDCTASATHADMPFDDFLQAILPLKDVYPRDSITVSIMGGEPLVRKDLADCGMRLRENGFRWGIVTNGFTYDRATHIRLLSAGMGSVTVSLDGLEENHNWLRCNDKSFEHAVRALELIVETPRLNYDTVTCVHKKNISELPDLKRFLIDKKVRNWRIFTIAPIGRAACDEQLQLSAQELKQLMDFIAETRKAKEINIYFSCEAYVGDYERRVRDSFFFCRAGVNIGSVLIDGSISACPNIHRSFAQGNIYTDSFLEVWQNRFQIMRDREWCKTGKCDSCKVFRDCRGGAMHLWDERRNGIKSCIYQKMEGNF